MTSIKLAKIEISRVHDEVITGIVKGKVPLVLDKVTLLLKLVVGYIKTNLVLAPQ